MPLPFKCSSYAARISDCRRNCAKPISSLIFKKKWPLCWAVRSRLQTRRRRLNGCRQPPVFQRGHRAGLCRPRRCPRLLLPPAATARAFPSGAVTRRVHPAPHAARALCADERQAVRAVLNSERFQDCSPAAINATLLDEGQYLCSTRSMYRILQQDGARRERRDQLTHPPYQKPELLATAPNQLWSWDITKLRG